MGDGLKKCYDRAMKISGTGEKGGYMNEDMADEKGMYEEKGSTAGCKCAGCMECKKAGGCDKAMCMGHKGSYMDEDNTDKKRMYSEESRMEMAKEGMALPDGSYPIKDKADLQNAIQAFGRAKDKEKAKKHIMKRAKELGLEDMIPENWMGGEKSVEETITMELAEFESLQEELKSLRVALD